jgi:hypothetical protein
MAKSGLPIDMATLGVMQKIAVRRATFRRFMQEDSPTGESNFDTGKDLPASTRKIEMLLSSKNKGKSNANRREIEAIARELIQAHTNFVSAYMDNALQWAGGSKDKVSAAQKQLLSLAGTDPEDKRQAELLLTHTAQELDRIMRSESQKIERQANYAVKASPSARSK